MQAISLEWVRHYLTDRTQVVEVGGFISQEFPLTTGVPQGSVLEPLLFLYYMQLLSMILRQHAISRHGYVDDIQLNNHFKLMDNGSLWEAIQSLEACASEVKTWI